EITQLIDRWLAAQNAGDFATYESLYAERFTGIRRSGARTVRFNRAGWIKDRRRMFAKRMTVSIADRGTAPLTGGARVTFVQTWESGAYKDVGRKQIILHREKNGLRIAREEMLESTVLGHATPPARTLGQFAFVILGEVVLASNADNKM